VTVAAPGLRAQKKKRTSDELRRVALELFVTHGFDAVTVDDVVAAADVSKTTFYRYFESKEDVVLGSAAERLDTMRSELLGRPADEPALDAIRHAFLAFAEQYQKDRERNVAIGRIMRTTPSLAARNLEHQAAWEALLREWIATREGLDRPELRHAVLAATAVASVRAAVDVWLLKDGKTHLPGVFAAAWRALDEIAGTPR
jgi:AcrR family transcriptional regulator